MLKMFLTIWLNFLSRESIPAEEQEAIFAEVYSQLQQLEITKKMKRKRTFVRPKRIG
jgi:large subunit ribosomal protein L19